MKDVNYTVRAPHPHARPVPRFIHLGRVDTRSPWHYPPHVHDNIEMILVRRGTVAWGLNSQVQRARAGDFYFVLPGQRHEDRCLKTPLFFYYLKFHLQDLRGNPIPLVVPGGPPARQALPGKARLFLGAFEDMYREVLRDAPGSRELIEARILECVWLLRRELGALIPPADPARSRHEALVEEVKQFLAGRLEQPVSAEQLARQLGLSTDHVGHVFRRLTGLTPLGWHGALRLEEAKRLLVETARSVGEVARQLGFEDSAYFSRWFSKGVGVSPERFRRRAEKSK